MGDVGPGALVMSKVGWVEVVLVEKCPMLVNKKNRVQIWLLAFQIRHVFSKFSWLSACTVLLWLEGELVAAYGGKRRFFC